MCVLCIPITLTPTNPHSPPYKPLLYSPIVLLATEVKWGHL